jgi:hypothetical protein
MSTAGTVVTLHPASRNAASVYRAPSTIRIVRGAVASPLQLTPAVVDEVVHTLLHVGHQQRCVITETLDHGLPPLRHRAVPGP